MTRRVQKVAELLKKMLAERVKTSLSESYGLVTLTDVEITADLKIACVYISCLEKQYQDEVLKKLSQKAKDFQHVLGRELQMKYTPKLNFKIDVGQEKINHVEEILNNIKKGK